MEYVDRASSPAVKAFELNIYFAYTGAIKRIEKYKLLLRDKISFLGSSCCVLPKPFSELLDHTIRSRESARLAAAIQHFFDEN